MFSVSKNPIMFAATMLLAGEGLRCASPDEGNTIPNLCPDRTALPRDPAIISIRVIPGDGRTPSYVRLNFSNVLRDENRHMSRYTITRQELGSDGNPRGEATLVANIPAVERPEERVGIFVSEAPRPGDPDTLREGVRYRYTIRSVLYERYDDGPYRSPLFCQSSGVHAEITYQDTRGCPCIEPDTDHYPFRPDRNPDFDTTAVHLPSLRGPFLDSPNTDFYLRAGINGIYPPNVYAPFAHHVRTALNQCGNWISDHYGITNTSREFLVRIDSSGETGGGWSSGTNYTHLALGDFFFNPTFPAQPSAGCYSHAVAHELGHTYFIVNFGDGPAYRNQSVLLFSEGLAELIGYSLPERRFPTADARVNLTDLQNESSLFHACMNDRRGFTVCNDEFAEVVAGHDPYLQGLKACCARNSGEGLRVFFDIPWLPVGQQHIGASVYFYQETSGAQRVLVRLDPPLDFVYSGLISSSSELGHSVDCNNQNFEYPMVRGRRIFQQYLCTERVREGGLNLYLFQERPFYHSVIECGQEGYRLNNRITLENGHRLVTNPPVTGSYRMAMAGDYYERGACLWRGLEELNPTGLSQALQGFQAVRFPGPFCQEFSLIRYLSHYLQRSEEDVRAIFIRIGADPEDFAHFEGVRPVCE